MLPATVADARTLAEYRRLMFTAMGQVVPGQGDDLVPTFERYAERELPAGRMVGWCREQKIRRLFLNATEDGRRIYAAFGFRASTTAMTLTLDLDDLS